MTTLDKRQYRKLPKVHLPCACCGSHEAATILRGDRNGLGLTTVICQTCGLIFTNPRPADEWFDTFYEHHYRQLYEAIDEPTVAYVNRPWVTARHQQNVGLLAESLPDTGRLLDIGASSGSFLAHFRQRRPDWSLEGVEPDRSFVQFARQHFRLDGVVQGYIDDLKQWPAAQYDLITAGHVIEHLLHPNSFFVLARRLLKPDGLLFLDLPNADRFRGMQDLHIGHVYHYTPHTLGNFLRKHGFNRVQIAPGTGFLSWTFSTLARKRTGTTSDWNPPKRDHRIGQTIKQIRRICCAPIGPRLYPTWRKAKLNSKRTAKRALKQWMK